MHKKAFVVDMHADTLLWPKRDFFKRNAWAHVDLPRLQEGNVALQMFTIVTSVPYGQSIESNYAPTHPAIDKLTPKVAVEVRPGTHSLELDTTGHGTHGTHDTRLDGGLI